jgi:uncharacterized protein
MSNAPMVVSLPTADRRTSYRFYSALGLVPVGEPAEDGVPEPLQFSVNEGLRIMLIPTVGFGWVIGDHEVASRGHSECILHMSTPTESSVRELVDQAHQAGATIVNQPAQQPWGYTGTFADPDGHLWMVEALAAP